MLPKPLIVPCLLLLAGVDAAGAQAVVRQDAAEHAHGSRSGSWSARSTTGLTLGGTWTAVPDSTGGAVTGTWTLADAQGGTAATGAWSAAWTPARRTGAWRAVMAGRNDEFAGTWTADAGLRADAPFADLFERAVRTVVSGGWRTGGRSGAWSVRAAAREDGR